MLFEFLGFLGITGFLVTRGIRNSHQAMKGSSYLKAQRQLVDQYFDAEFYDQLERDMRYCSGSRELWQRVEQYKRNRGYYYLVYSKDLAAHWGTRCEGSRWRQVGRTTGPIIVNKKTNEINYFLHNLLMFSYDKPTMKYIEEQMKTTDFNFRKQFLLDGENRLRYSPELAAELLEHRWIERADGEDHDALVYFIGGYEFDPDDEQHRRHVALIINENIKNLAKPNSWYPQYPPEIIGPLYKAETIAEYEEFLTSTGFDDNPVIRQNVLDREQRMEEALVQWRKKWEYITPPSYVPESTILDELLCCILQISRLNW